MVIPQATDLRDRAAMMRGTVAARNAARQRLADWARCVGGCSRCAASRCVARAVDLQVVDHDFLEKQGDARILRVAKLSANRGMILDRNGEPLAVSTPVDTVWANPRELAQVPQEFPRLAKALDRDRSGSRAASRQPRPRVPLPRAAHAPAGRGQGEGARHSRRRHDARVPALLPGGRGDGPRARLHQHRRRRPGRARAGVRPVARRRARREARDARQARPHDRGRREDHAPRPGQDLRTSIDLRIQYLAYRELKAAVQANHARVRLRGRDRRRRPAKCWRW